MHVAQPMDVGRLERLACRLSGFTDAADQVASRFPDIDALTAAADRAASIETDGPAVVAHDRGGLFGHDSKTGVIIAFALAAALALTVLFIVLAATDTLP